MLFLSNDKFSHACNIFLQCCHLVVTFKTTALLIGSVKYCHKTKNLNMSRCGCTHRVHIYIITNYKIYTRLTIKYKAYMVLLNRMRESTEGDIGGLFMGRKDGYRFKNQLVPFSLHTVLKITRMERARK